MVESKLWCRVRILGPGGDEIACRVLAGSGDPDIGTVDDVARLGLLASRLGGGMVIAELSAELRALLDMTGLRAELERSGVEVERQTELGEEPVRVQKVQEERRRADLSP